MRWFLHAHFDLLSLVVVDIIKIVGVTIFEAKDDPPVCPHSNAPEAPEIASKAVESKARQVHVFRPAGSIENSEDIFYFLPVIRADPLRFSLFK
jgi:hypothetical protein